MSEGGGPNEFRTALGAFATGVTIVTTMDSAGAPVGVTASSFNSVSLDPPLVLWSLAKSAQSRDAFCTSGHFAIHVLAESQEATSNRFAHSGEDKFAGVAWSVGTLGSPILDDHAAVFQCRTRYQHEGGDHIILVGEVTAFERRDEPPLLFHGGSYAERRPRPPAVSVGTIDLDNGEFTDDFLFYLIARAYFQSSRPARRKMAELGLDQQQHAVLITLSMQPSATAQQIGGMLQHSDHAPDGEALKRMVASNLLAQNDDTYELTAFGRSQLIQVLAVSQAFEADIGEQMSRGELAEVRRLLRRIIDLTGLEVPIAWRA
jgi:3-hydroxy-9,10-secoandrosta-1,3,5(10)-triene-9,17-dione monooxygenase reductase component